MPHYSDGTPAQPGDIVRGKGYNVKDANGELAEVTGVLINVVEASACNVTVLLPEEPIGSLALLQQPGQAVVLNGRLEYGQADHFELVSRYESSSG